tara:strand:+ start:2262 stop:2717 length:456 start_codon:yes stop_codon:yes gene_type:complete
MNHCLIQSVIKTNPQMRYTKENQTPIAEMMVGIKGLRNDDPINDLKVLGWGTIAQEMIDQLKEGNNVVLEGRLRMNSVTRKDGTKEKQAELTASRIHHITKREIDSNEISSDFNQINRKETNEDKGERANNPEKANWNSAPLVPEVDEIPF